MKKDVLPKILPFFLIGLLLLRLHLAFNRYFDSDEMSHMHWAWLSVHGKIMYKDFFFYNLPFFQWLLAPVFLLPADETLLILARVWQFAFYIGAIILLYRLVNRLTNNTTIGLTSLIIFIAFPMTLDKTIDIRPDIQMMVFYLLGLDIILHTRSWNNIKMFILGLSTSLSVFITFKNLFAIPALLYAFIAISPHTKQLKHFLWLTFGLGLPALIFLLFLITTNTFSLAYTSIVHDSVAVTAGKIPFSPWKALSPWPLVYMQTGGVSYPWIINIGIWILAILGLILFVYRKPKLGSLVVLYIGVAILFLFLFPAPYLQYFIPLSFFGSFLSAYAIFDFLHVLNRNFPQRLPVITLGTILPLCFLLLYSLYLQYSVRITPHYDNREQLGVVKSILSMTKPNETFYDMVGSYIFRPDGYYLCCHPYQEFIDRLQNKPDSLPDALVKNQTKFIVLDRTGLSLWQPRPEDLRYIKSNYLVSGKNWKIYMLGWRFGCNKGTCMQYDMDNTPVWLSDGTLFRVPVTESFMITTTPPNDMIAIDNRWLSNGPTEITAGIHALKVDKTTQSVTIQLFR